MIIDLILDRKDGEPFGDVTMQYNSILTSSSISI